MGAGQIGLTLDPGQLRFGKGTWPVMASVWTKARGARSTVDRTGYVDMVRFDGEYKACIAALLCLRNLPGKEFGDRHPLWA
jgi:hypothetical protein